VQADPQTRQALGERNRARDRRPSNCKTGRGKHAFAVSKFDRFVDFSGETEIVRGNN
jgi:hypothetical protein